MAVCRSADCSGAAQRLLPCSVQPFLQRPTAACTQTTAAGTEDLAAHSQPATVLQPSLDRVAGITATRTRMTSDSEFVEHELAAGSGWLFLLLAIVDDADSLSFFV